MAVAIVLAGGSGSRMNSDVAKQYIKLNDREVLYYSLYTFQKNENISRIILVTRETDIEFCKNEIVAKYGFDKVSDVIAGGRERYNSVYNGIVKLAEYNKCSGDKDTDADLLYGKNDSNCDEIVLIHDAIRPLVPKDVISECIAVTKQHGNAIVCIPCQEAMLETTDKISSTSSYPRDNLKRTQTPQGFRLKTILDAHKKALEMGITNSVASCTLMIEIGEKVYFSTGSEKNIKLTTQEDVEIFKAMLKGTKDAI